MRVGVLFDGIWSTLEVKSGIHCLYLQRPHEGPIKQETGGPVNLEVTTFALVGQRVVDGYGKMYTVFVEGDHHDWGPIVELCENTECDWEPY